MLPLFNRFPKTVSLRSGTRVDPLGLLAAGHLHPFRPVLHLPLVGGVPLEDDLSLVLAPVLRYSHEVFPGRFTLKVDFPDDFVLFFSGFARGPV
ncbi:MAG TPA: hypothetical protein VIU40_10725, partial [Geobacteraceae bacterium]